MSYRSEALVRLENKLKTVTSGCREFTGGRDPLGYGWFWFEGRPHSAHRVMWILHNGQPPPDKPQVLHSCDNPPCCELSHLRVGTNADNVADREARGRGFVKLHPELSPFRLYPDRIPRMKGERNGHAKLTASQVEDIFVRRSLGESNALLAREFGVSSGNISRITTGQGWVHVTEPLIRVLTGD